MNNKRRPIVLTTEELADMFGVTPRWIQKMAKEGNVLRSLGPNRWDLWDNCKRYIEYNKGKTVGSKLQEAKLRVLESQAEKNEIANKLSMGELVYLKDVEPRWNNILVSIRDAFLAVPDSIAPRLHKAKTIGQLRKILLNKVRDTLERLAEFSGEES